MLIDSAPMWVTGTNCWVVAPEAGGPAIVVDAPPDASGILALLARHDLIPVAVLLTHGHVDHLGGVGSVTRPFALSAYLHPDDEWLAADPRRQLETLWGAAPPGDFEQPERYEHLHDGQALDLAGIALSVLHTPGHTPGHCCFSVPAAGALFSGDQLFAGSIGRTDLPGGDFHTLMKSMAERVLPLPPDTVVFPGHGPTTTLARELETNPFLETFR